MLSLALQYFCFKNRNLIKILFKMKRTLNIDSFNTLFYHNLLLVFIMSCVFLSCQHISDNQDSESYINDENELLKLQEKEELNKKKEELSYYKKFNDFNTIIYKCISNYDVYKKRFVYHTSHKFTQFKPVKRTLFGESIETIEKQTVIKTYPQEGVPNIFQGVIYFDDLVFICNDLSYPRVFHRNFENEELNNIEFSIFKLRDPLASAWGYAQCIIEKITFLGQIIEDNRSSSILALRKMEFVENYFKNVSDIRLRSKDKVYQRIKDMIYLEYGNDFDMKNYDIWYQIVENEFFDFKSKNQKAFEKLYRAVELGIQE